MTPKCCENCYRLNENGSCGTYSTCQDWLRWFRGEWDGIRKAAKLLKQDCLTCKYFIYCPLDKQAFYKTIGGPCREYEEDPNDGT